MINFSQSLCVMMKIWTSANLRVHCCGLFQGGVSQWFYCINAGHTSCRQTCRYITVLPCICFAVVYISFVLGTVLFQPSMIIWNLHGNKCFKTLLLDQFVCLSMRAFFVCCCGGGSRMQILNSRSTNWDMRCILHVQLFLWGSEKGSCIWVSVAAAFGDIYWHHQ